MPNPLSLDDFAAMMAPRQLDARIGAYEHGAGTCPKRGKSQNGIDPTLRWPMDSEESSRILFPMNDYTVGP